MDSFLGGCRAAESARRTPPLFKLVPSGLLLNCMEAPSQSHDRFRCTLMQGSHKAAKETEAGNSDFHDARRSDAHVLAQRRYVPRLHRMAWNLLMPGSRRRGRQATAVTLRPGKFGPQDARDIPVHLAETVFGLLLPFRVVFTFNLQLPCERSTLSERTPAPQNRSMLLVNCILQSATARWVCIYQT